MSQPTPANPGEERFKRLVAILIASVTVLAAIVTFLQSNAGAQAAQAGRDAQRFAIQAMGRKTGGQARVSYDWQGAFQAWAELNDLALLADTTRDDPAAVRYRAVRDRMIDLSPLLGERYFDAGSGNWPDVPAYEADTYLVETTELSERYAASAARQNAWSDRAGVHIVQLTLLAVSLALFGLSTTLSAASRRLFIAAGAGVVVVTLVWLIAVAAQPIPALADHAIEAYARGVGLAHQNETEDAIAAFDEALAAAPDYANALYERGNAHYTLNDLDQAAADYEAAAAAGRDDTYVGWNLGWTYYLQGRFEDAARVDARVLEKDAGLIGVRLNLGLARLAGGETDAARADYAEAMETAAQVVADAQAAGQEPPASLWFYLDAGSLDLQNLVDRLNEDVHDWTQAPSPETIKDPDAAQRAAQELIAELKSLTASLEFTGRPPGERPAARISAFQFAREVTDDAGDFVQYDVADAFHYLTKKVQVLFDYEEMQPGQPVLYKVYRNGAEYTSLRLSEEWPAELAESGSAQKPLSYAYSKLFILPAGRYGVEMYVDYHLMQRGSFSIQPGDAPVTGPAGSVLFRDGFTDSSFAQWTRRADEDSTRENVDNRYRIHVAADNLAVFANPGLNFVDAQIDVDAVRAGGPDSGEAGVICRYQDADNFYVLKITHDGYTGISKLKADEWSTLADWQASSAIRLGDEAINHLRAECVGDRLALYVNDQLVAEARDADFAFGDVGLLAGTFDDAGADVYFDDFVVQQPSAAGSVLYQEDFSDPGSGWARYQDADYATEYAEGGYRIRVTADNYTVWSHPGFDFADAQIEVEATLIGGPIGGEFGIVCRYQDGDNYYALKITGDGYSAIHKRASGEWIALADWQASDAIRQGVDAANRLRADCAGDRLALYANDQLLVEARDADFISGDIGLLAGTFEEPGVDVLFDNLILRQPQGAARSPSDGDVLYADDFSDPASGWARSEEDGYITEYVDGAYRITLTRDTFTVWSQAGLEFDDVSIEVDATKIAGPDNNNFGIVCRFQDNDNFYLLQAGSDGTYAIAKRQAGEWRLLGSGEFEFSAAIRQGEATNHLQADCVGDRLALVVNGEWLAEAQDAGFASGDVGLLAGAFDVGGVEIAFDNFVVRRP
jgi:tetratricopeptide (TPR) repeat protein